MVKQAALGDLPRQARRLVRALASRAKPDRPARRSPLRLGTPPGFSRRPRHEIDHLLQSCQARADYALNPDTS